MKRLKNRWLLLSLVLPLALTQSLVASAADDPKKYDDNYNFSWLDPDKKIYVLQNRRYLKSPKLMLSVLGGSASGGPYRTAGNINGRLAFYFTEQFGVEGFAGVYFNSENNVYEALKVQSPNSLPTVRMFRSEYGGLFKYAPWYAKINVYNSILYFDWYFTAGAGLALTDLDTRKRTRDASRYISQSIVAGYLGTGHLFHLNERWVFRLDVLGSIFPAPIYGDTGPNSWYSNWTYTAGIGFRL